MEDGSVYVTRSTQNNNVEGSYVSQAAMTGRIIGTQVGETETDGSSNGIMTLELEPGQTVYIVTAIAGGGETYDSSPLPELNEL